MSAVAVSLIVRLVELKRVFKFFLPLRVRGESVALRGFARRIKLEQLVGHVFHRVLYARFGLGPCRSAQSAQRRMHALTRPIFLDQVQPRERHVKLRRFGKLQHHVFAGDLALLNFLQPLVHSDAVLHMDNKVTHRKIAEV